MSESLSGTTAELVARAAAPLSGRPPETAAPSRGGIAVISDFNSGNLARLLDEDPSPPALRTESASFGEVFPPLLDPRHACWKDGTDAAVVWTRPEGVIPAFREALELQRPDCDRIAAEVDAFADAVIQLAGRTRCVILPTWTVPAHERGWGMQDMRSSIGVANLLARMNLQVADRLEGARRSVFQLNAQPWLERAGRRAFDSKLWYIAKVPFANAVFQEAVKDIKSALLGLEGGARKLVIVDLDDTLWGGIVGDVGWEGLQLGGHSPLGEAFADFQRGLKALLRRGILLAIVSKNEEAAVLEAFKKHPEMQLALDDFSARRINWNDKAANIVEVVEELNLGLQSVVFIDDNPLERGRVREMLPEVLVPEWPAQKMLYRQALAELRCFDAPSVSSEDLDRTRMYAAERRREALKERLSSPDDWLRTLELRVRVEPLRDANLPRAAQLFNKTNQMNLSTRRMSEGELARWASGEGRRLWTFRVADRFGDSGLTGIVSLEARGDRGVIVDLVLSCRVFGRRIEDAMLHVALRHARRLGLGRVEAVYVPTAKNKPCLDFLRGRSGPQEIDQEVEAGPRFVWDLSREHRLPDGLQLEEEG